MKSRRVSLLGGLVLAALLAVPAAEGAAPRAAAAPAAGVYAVTRLDDPVPDTCAVNGCSLREAVMAANANPGSDVITLVSGSTYTLSRAPSGGDDATTGDLNLTDSVSFNLTGLCIFIDPTCGVTIRGGAAWNDRLVHVHAGAAVQMDQITFANGHPIAHGGAIFIGSGGVLTLTAGTVMSSATDAGGGIYSDGSLTLNGTIVELNSAADESGGGIFSSALATRLVIDNAAILSNTAHLSGGGLAAEGPATLRHTLVRHNDAATGDGGGLWLSVDGSTLTDMTIVSNTALSGASFTGVGGGLFVADGLITVSNATLGQNAAVCGAGIGVLGNGTVEVANSVILSNTATFGGGVCGLFSSSTYTVTNSTVSGNSATQDGGGLNLEYGALYNVTVTNNQADSDHNGTGDGGGLFLGGATSALVGNSLFAGNSDSGGQPPECNGGGALISLGYNLFQGANNCFVTGVTTGTLNGANPQLSLLGDHGGPTWTQALPQSSPAINAGNPTGCRDDSGQLLVSDQRGERRWDRCDIGAFEFQPALLFLPLARR